MMHVACMFAAAALLLATAAVPVHAQVADHLKCYQVKDSLNLAGTVDLDTPQFGLDPGCKISKAKLFCVPGTKTNVNVVDKKTNLPITPLPVSGPDPGDRICYKVKCLAVPTDQTVTDQFGTRTLTKLKPSLLCAPAIKGTPTPPSTPTPIPTVTPTTTPTPVSGCNVACTSAVPDANGACTGNCGNGRCGCIAVGNQCWCTCL